MELSAPITILILAISGYYFSTQCYLLKYRIYRENGHRLYLTSATCGLVLFYISVALCRGQEFLWLDLLKYKPLFVLTNGWEYHIATIATPLLAYVATTLINKIDDIKERSLIAAWERDDIDALCYEAISEFKPISVTLESRKNYIGLVYDTLEPEKEGYLTILPLYSGYRSAENLELKLVKKYTSVYTLITKLEYEVSDEEFENTLSELRDYRVIIPRKDIATLNISANLLHKEITEPELSI